MKKIVLLFLLFPSFLVAQNNIYISVFAGLSNYQGDLRDKQFSFDQTQPAFGLNFTYVLSTHLALRTGIIFSKIEGDDKKNVETLKYRNLNFRTNILEGNLLLEYAISDFDMKGFTPYLFAGIGLYHFNPYSYDTLNRKIYLQPLGTEGEGLPQYPERKIYPLTQWSIPFGGGIRFAISENWSLGYEFGFRKLFTDYLDDVSSTYVDPQLLARAHGAIAVQMSYRGGELPHGSSTYPAVGSMRGKAENKDWYYFHGIVLTLHLNSGTGPNAMHEKSGKRGSLDCPRVW